MLSSRKIRNDRRNNALRQRARHSRCRCAHHGGAGLPRRASRGEVSRPASAIRCCSRAATASTASCRSAQERRAARTSTNARSCSPRTGPRSARRRARTARARSTCWASPASSCSPRRCSTTPRCWRAARTSTSTYAVARAHTRHMVDFCSVDRRLLPTGYVPLVDFERTAQGGARGDRARRQGADDPVALPGRPFAQPYRLRSAVGDRPGGRPADRVPCRRRRQAARGGLLQQRPAAGAGLPWRRRQFQVDRLHGDRLSADEGADRADRRSRARPLPRSEVRRHRAGRVVGAGLDAQHGFARTTPSTRTRSGCRRCRSSPASS